MLTKKIASVTLVLLMITVFFSGCLTEDSEGITFEHPEEVRIDERFGVTIKGLPNDDYVTFKMITQDYQGRNWSYEKEIYTNDGTIDLSANETMWMIQMKEPVDDEIIRVMYYPPKSKWNLTLSVEYNNETLKSSNVTRTFGDPGVTSHNVEDDDLIGEVFLPPGDLPAPGVLVLHGSEGRKPFYQAHMLASNGFVALALQYFGLVDGEPVEQIPNDLREVPLEYIEKAGEWLQDHDRVKGDQVGIIGYSKGGELALLASSYFEIFGPTVSLVGSGVVWPGLTFGSNTFLGTSSWSYQNEPVPYVPYWASYSSSLGRASEETVENATIPVENIDGSILFVSGGNDAIWNVVETIEIAMERLQKNDFKFEFEHLVYEDAGHYIWPPYLPTANYEWAGGRYGGGTSEGYAEANSDHWPRVLETLREV